MATESKGGRPTAYKKEYAEQARKLCLLGHTDAEMAAFFEVSEQTINAWKHAHPAFLESIKKGKEFADADVVSNLFNRAMGYTTKERREERTADGLKKIEAEKHIPGDVTAMIFWLKNRQRTRWRDKQEVEHSGTIETMSDEELNAKLARLVNAQSETRGET